ncbi:hypothetical protein RFI_28820 [Reticulomyxa filosa]|uniref:Uncharacterized protein n=1 Tax=Reticulomyxa filosa TaxID=46433 RepID=X6M4J1_RETFI|nr:hypothetical protein RFI_28820 [Reticulomyxa filosa]|eukprot:ETO08566.1 hypothetical protein RFI_28820 [Reticulomyxa filosa]
MALDIGKQSLKHKDCLGIVTFDKDHMIYHGRQRVEELMMEKFGFKFVFFLSVCKQKRFHLYVYKKKNRIVGNGRKVLDMFDIAKGKMEKRKKKGREKGLNKSTIFPFICFFAVVKIFFLPLYVVEIYDDAVHFVQMPFNIKPKKSFLKKKYDKTEGQRSICERCPSRYYFLNKG